VGYGPWRFVALKAPFGHAICACAACVGLTCLECWLLSRRGRRRWTVSEMSDVGERPAWNDAQAAKLVGATVLIGITRLDTARAEQEQMFGVIRSANAHDGFEVSLKGSRAGETYWLPPDLRNIHPAAPGEYRLRSTGEVVTNPDYTSTWTIHPPNHVR